MPPITRTYQDLHLETFKITEGAMLLVLTIGYICGAVLRTADEPTPLEAYELSVETGSMN